MPKTVSKIRLQKGGQVPKQGNAIREETQYEPQDGNEWHFKITGKGTSGWMSWVQEGSTWVQLRQSNTSFISAIAAIEPEVMRLAFPHKVTARKNK
jgi:hypothetical protein